MFSSRITKDGNRSRIEHEKLSTRATKGILSSCITAHFKP